MRRIRIWASAVSALVSSATLAAPTVNPPTLQGWTIAVSGSNVTIESPVSATPIDQSFQISTSQFADAIGEIRVLASSSETIVRLVVTGHDDLGVRSVRSVIRDPNSAGEVWITLLRCYEDIGVGQFGTQTRDGLIRVNRIVAMESARNCFADITVLPSTLAGNGTRAINSLTVTADMAQYWSDGNLFSNIDVDTRGIGSIVIENTIGTFEPNPVRVRIKSLSDVDLIQAGSLERVDFDMANAVIARIAVTDGGWGGDPVIPPQSPVTQPQPPPTGNSTVGGSLVAKRIRSLNLWGNLESNVTVSQTSADDVWRVGRAFNSPGRINLPDNGLKHQIIVNQQNVDGVWDNNAPVYVGQTRIQDGYLNSPPQLGNGAVGVARFRLHELAGNVAQGVSVSNGGVDPNSTLEPPPRLSTTTRATSPIRRSGRMGEGRERAPASLLHLASRDPRPPVTSFPLPLLIRMEFAPLPPARRLFWFTRAARASVRPTSPFHQVCFATLIERHPCHLSHRPCGGRGPGDGNIRGPHRFHLLHRND